MSEVRVYEDKMTIKTYVIEDPDVNPFIVEYLGMLNFYPYPLKDKVSKEPRDVTFDVYCLENEFFKITVLPALGGKLYSCYDKRSQEDIFYRNPVVKPQMIGTTGAWTSGGIEFNFPNRGHRPSATDFTDTVMRNYADGSASIVISDIDRISWLRFSVELRLYTRKAYIEQTTRVYNPNDYSDSYYVWSTSSELERPGLVWRYPTHWYIEEDSMTRNLWPYGDGDQDLRYNDTIKQFALPFTSEVLKDYMGLYDPTTNSGVVHVADYRDVPGKKLWSWGTASSGRLWCKRLTDNDDCYVELQTGAVETQNQFNFLEPHNSVLFKEYWLYSSDNGPLCAASKDVICSYTIKDGRIDFSLISTDRFPKTDLVLYSGGREVFRKGVDLDPRSNTEVSVSFSIEWMDSDIEVVLICGRDVLLRETVLENDSALEMIDREEYVPTHATMLSDTAEAIRAEKFRFYNKALELNKQLIENNPEYTGAYIQLARCYLKKGLYREALDTLEDVAKVNEEDVELQYYYGLALWHTSHEERALKIFFRIPNTSKLFAAGSYFTALAHVIKGEYEKAFPKLEYSLEFQAFHYKSRLLQAYALAKGGYELQACELLQQHIQEHPIDYVALYLLDKLGKTEDYRTIVLGQSQNIYEVLAFLDEVKDWESACRLLTDYSSSQDADQLLVCYDHYYKGLLLGVTDFRGLQEAVEAISLDYVFPNHKLDRKILATIKDQSPKAKYLYGLLSYSAEDYNTAKLCWTELVDGDYEYSVVYRNLAFYYQKFENDCLRAIEIAQRGLDKQPRNDHLYAILAHCYLQVGDHAQCRSLVTTLAELKGRNETGTSILVDLLNNIGDYEAASKVLGESDFHVWEHSPEGLISYTKLYKETHLGLARNALRDKDYDKAADAVGKCLGMEKRYEEKFCEPLFYMGLIQEKLGNFESAVEYYQQAVAEDAVRDDAENYRFVVKAAHRLVSLDWLGIR